MRRRRGRAVPRAGRRGREIAPADPDSSLPDARHPVLPSGAPPARRPPGLARRAPGIAARADPAQLRICRRRARPPASRRSTLAGPPLFSAGAAAAPRRDRRQKLARPPRCPRHLPAIPDTVMVGMGSGPIPRAPRSWPPPRKNGSRPAGASAPRAFPRRPPCRAAGRGRTSPRIRAARLPPPRPRSGARQCGALPRARRGAARAPRGGGSRPALPGARSGDSSSRQPAGAAAAPRSPPGAARRSRGRAGAGSGEAAARAPPPRAARGCRGGAPAAPGGKLGAGCARAGRRGAPRGEPGKAWQRRRPPSSSGGFVARLGSRPPRMRRRGEKRLVALLGLEPRGHAQPRSCADRDDGHYGRREDDYRNRPELGNHAGADDLDHRRAGSKVN